MHHQTDSLHDSNYFQIFPTLVAMYELKGYHPAEEQKVKTLIDKEHSDTKTFLNDNRLLLLKQHINDCIKAYSNEYGAQYYEIKDSWYKKIPNGQGLEPTTYPEELFIGYYFPNAQEQSCHLLLDAPFRSNVQVPAEKSVSIYTARDEKILIDSGRLIIVPASVRQQLTKNTMENMDVIMFNVQSC